MSASETEAQRIEYLSDLGRHPEVIAEGQKFLAREPGHLRVLYLVGHSAYQINAWDTVKEMGRKLLATHPDNSVGYELMALAAAHADQDRMMAERYFREVIARRPESGRSYFLLAQYLLEFGADARVLSYAEKAVALNPDDSAALGLLAEIYRKLGRAAEAEALLETSLALNPESLRRQLDMALTHLKAGRKKEARDTLKMALRAGPQHVRPFRLARALTAYHPWFRFAVMDTIAIPLLAAAFWTPLPWLILRGIDGGFAPALETTIVLSAGTCGYLALAYLYVGQWYLRMRKGWL